MPLPLFTFQNGPNLARAFYRGTLAQGQSLAYSTDDPSVLLVEQETGLAYYTSVVLQQVVNAAITLGSSARLTHTATGWGAGDPSYRRVGDPPDRIHGQYLRVPTSVADGELMLLGIPNNVAGFADDWGAYLPGWSRVLRFLTQTRLDVSTGLFVYARVCSGDQGRLIAAAPSWAVPSPFAPGLGVLRCYQNASVGATAVEDMADGGIADPAIRTPVTLSGVRAQFFAVSAWGIAALGAQAGGSDPAGLSIRSNEQLVTLPDGQVDVPRPLSVGLMTEDLSGGGGALTVAPDPLTASGADHAHFTCQVQGSNPLLSATALVKVLPDPGSSGGHTHGKFLAIHSVSSLNGGAVIAGGALAGL